MIFPGSIPGAAFGDAEDGDGRNDLAVRRRLAERHGIPEQWATIHQVHGADVVSAAGPGDLGEADALYTSEPGLALAVATADCAPVVLAGPGGVGIAHAGWRGADAGVVTRLRAAMEQAGSPPTAAAIGPAIGPCCFEVGPEVAERFPGRTAATTWGTTSVDLPGAVGDALDGLQVWSAGACTMHDANFHSHRRDSTAHRQIALAWLPA